MKPLKEMKQKSKRKKKAVCNWCKKEADIRPHHKTGICWECCEKAEMRVYMKTIEEAGR